MSKMSDALSAQRSRNFKAMRSPASIALGIGAVVLVALVSVFYDHPAMQTPRVVSVLHSGGIPGPL